MWTTITEVLRDHLRLKLRLLTFSDRFFFLVQVSALLICFVLYRHLPHAGIAVAFLGAVAAVMSLHSGMGRTQKFTWIAIVGVLLVVELRAARKDRFDADDAQVKSLIEEKRRFQQVLDRQEQDLRETLATEQSDFTATEERQQQGFEQTLAGLRTTVDQTNQAVANTKPRALMRIEGLSEGVPGSGYTVLFDKPTTINVTFRNAGTDTATEVYVSHHFYIEKADSKAVQEDIQKRFDRDWRIYAKGPSTVPTGDHLAFQTFKQTMPGSDLLRIRNDGATVYSYGRIAYKDSTGEWFSDRCVGIQDALRGGSVLHPCLIPNTSSERIRASKSDKSEKERR